MPYRISADGPEGAVTFRSGTPNGALRVARELIEQGLLGGACATPMGSNILRLILNGVTPAAGITAKRPGV